MARIDRHGDLLVFVHVADTGGFGRAARTLGISTSQASRALARLEDRLGTRLMNRTTRRVALTEAGRALHERARTLLAELDEAEAAVGDRGGELHGTLRVSMPVHFGLLFLAAPVSEFAARHPHLHLELGFEDRRVDVVEEGVDVAVRIGVLADSSLIARRLGRTRGLSVASGAYLLARGTPAHPRELADHDVLHYRYESPGPSWRMSGPDGETVVRVQGRFGANNGIALREAALAGLGVARLPDFMVAGDLREGRLVRILQPWEAEIPISAVYPPGRHLSPKVRLFVDFLATRLAGEPWSQCGSSDRGSG